MLAHVKARSPLILALLALGCRDDGVVIHAEPPLVNIFEPSDGSSFYEDEEIEFRAQLDVVDGTALDDLTHRWVSGNKTLCEEDYAPSDGIVVCFASFSKAGEYSVTVTAKSPMNDRATDSVPVVIDYNEPPGVEIISPDDGSIFQDASFIVFEADIWDLEDEADQLYVTLESSIEGDLGVEPYGSTSGQWTAAVEGLADGNHLLTITVEDTAGKTGQDSISLRAGNTAPGLDSANIEPTPLYTLDDAECVPSGWVDDEGDPERYHFRWFLNSTEDTGETTEIYPYAKTIKGDQLQCEVTAYDEYENGDIVNSPTVTVVNTPPSQPVIAIVPPSPEPEEDLTCLITVPSQDDDEDAVTYEYTWYQNGNLVGALTGSVADSSYTEHTDTWECQVRAWDGEEYSAMSSDSVSVMDQTAPDAPVIDSLHPYRNDEDIELTGTCEADCALSFYFSDSTGTWTESATCDSQGTFSHPSYVTRGYSTDIYATCEDAAANVSTASNTVTTEACDPEDTWEASGGDSYSTAIGGFTTLPDNNSVTITIEGNALDSSDEDWYALSLTNTSSGTNDDNPFNLEVDLTSGSSVYNFTIYTAQNSPVNCGTSSYQSFDFYQYDQGDGSHAPPSDTSKCSSSGSSLYNTCDDFAATYTIQVQRNSAASPSCEHYELTITNGDAP